MKARRLRNRGRIVHCDLPWTFKVRLVDGDCILAMRISPCNSSSHPLQGKILDAAEVFRSAATIIYYALCLFFHASPPCNTDVSPTGVFTGKEPISRP
ncbi:hypothetical protein L210DRAFT_118044 [Boletus edulis BED1]|uniref:Uncharacterized protein n=1 Tax=Boletus edulis BED1 TaxID=1328754 RepID=A0AAD4GBG8_BOLED|nr:hypothetical protein L210DRAFT_118044 [Boletus edulis BED1]